MEYYYAIKKKEILPFVATWVNLEDVMLSEICMERHRKANSLWCHFCVEPKKVKLIEPDRSLNGGCQGLEGRGSSERWGNVGQRVHIFPYKMNKFW